LGFKQLVSITGTMNIIEDKEEGFYYLLTSLNV